MNIDLHLESLDNKSSWKQNKLLVLNWNLSSQPERSRTAGLLFVDLVRTLRTPSPSTASTLLPLPPSLPPVPIQLVGAALLPPLHRSNPLSWRYRRRGRSDRFPCGALQVALHPFPGPVSCVLTEGVKPTRMSAREGAQRCMQMGLCTSLSARVHLKVF